MSEPTIALPPLPLADRYIETIYDDLIRLSSDGRRLTRAARAAYTAWCAELDIPPQPIEAAAADPRKA